jgi:hypothetical protein
VAQQLLHAADVGPAIQKMRGEAVSQGVRRGALVEARHLQVLLQQTADAARRQPAAELVDEHRRGGAGLLARFELPHVEPMPDRPHGERADGRQPLAPPLAADADDVGGKIHVRVVQPDRFAHAEAGRIHRLEDRPIAQPHRLIARRGFEQPAKLVRREEVRQLPRPARVPQRLGRIALTPPLASAKAKEAPQRSQPAGDRGLRVALAVHVGHIAAKQHRGDFAGRRALAAARLDQVRFERRQVFAVALERQLRGIALDPQIAEEGFDGRMHETQGFRVRGSGFRM